MSSPLTDKINALTAYANEVTGESDTTLSDAVASLADGYGQGGGGSFPAKVKDITITMEADYTQANYLSVSLEPLAQCAILVVVDSVPSPPSSGYITMWWSQGRTTSTTNDTKGIIMRTDGTYGTDINACNYNASTGVLKVGGPYGIFPQGATYHIYQYSFES